jgi:hypothetical protein
LKYSKYFSTTSCGADTSPAFALRHTKQINSARALIGFLSLGFSHWVSLIGFFPYCYHQHSNFEQAKLAMALGVPLAKNQPTDFYSQIPIKTPLKPFA